MTYPAAKDAPDILAFPPAVTLGAVVAAVALDWLWPLGSPPRLVWLGGLLIVMAFGVAGAGVRAFKAAKTNVDPRKPALILVETGPYQFSRNPMYLGMVVLQIGVALAFAVEWALIGAVVVWAVLHWGVVLREEAYLSAKFGAPYEAYLQRTRRWL